MNLRQKIDCELKGLLEADPKVLAAWEGGSAATGYLDEWSDLDLCVICRDDHVEEVWMAMEELLEKKFGIEVRFIMPEPTWHGHAQRFLKLRKSPELYYLDVVVMRESSGNRFQESDRHGNAVIWFDREALLDSTPTPDEIVEQKTQAYHRIMVDSFPFLELDVRKQIKRENWIDAMDLYYRLIFSRLAAALNLKYRIARHDFGLRYTYRDFPDSVVIRLEELMTVHQFQDLAGNVDEIVEWFHELMSEFDNSSGH